MWRLYKELNRRAIEKIVKQPMLYWRSGVALITFNRVTPKLAAIYLTGQSVWDLGAGDQTYRQLLEPFVASYYSLDTSADRSLVDTVGDIQHLPLASGSIEAIYSAQVLEHVPQPWQAFTEFERVLKPEGVAVISVPHLGYLHNLPHDYYRFTEFGLRALATQANLSVLEVLPLGGFFSFLGYIRSSVIQPLYGLPVIGRLILELNYWWSCLEVWLDNRLHLTQLFPLNYLIVVQKK